MSSTDFQSERCVKLNKTIWKAYKKHSINWNCSLHMMVMINIQEEEICLFGSAIVAIQKV